ncbi:leucine-rich repeat domain-containing protein [Ethanoligenens sp.]|uniref:leucine-rich repeat domain-containing protein n=1 Tax=Ethanoligenens sp. TaxID=2099655 RepID=UPI0039E7C1C4
MNTGNKTSLAQTLHKKILAAALALAVAIALPVTAFADGSSSSGTKSNSSDFVIEQGVLKQYTGADSTVVIPAGVTSIGSSAFYKNQTVASIVLPEGVISIGDYAFSQCVNLKTISLPSTLTSIGDFQFWGDSKLTNVVLPAGLTDLARGSFEDCTSLTSITIPNGITELRSWMFWGCTSLSTINLPSTLTKVDGGAFAQTPWQKSHYGDYVVMFGALIGYQGDDTVLTIPSGVTSLGDSVFEGNEKITSVTIPSGVESIGRFTFNGCKNLRTINFPSTLTSLGDGVFTETLWYDAQPDFVVVNHILVDYKGSDTEITIPSGTTALNTTLFYGTKATKIVIPEGVTKIGSYALCDSETLTSVNIPASVQDIGISAFSDDPNLTLTVVPGTFGEEFAQLSSIKYVSAPAAPESTVSDATSQEAMVSDTAQADKAAPETVDSTVVKNPETGFASGTVSLYGLIGIASAAVFTAVLRKRK